MTKARILVVEDEGIIALDLQDRLTDLGYTVSSVAVSGEEAVRKTAEMRPDLVLMNIHLRGKLDGVETTKRIRSQFNIPVIYLTTYIDEAIFQRAQVTEPFGYILKPFDKRELHTNIEIALFRHQLEERLQQHNEELTILNTIGTVLGQSMKLQELLHKAMNEVLKAMQLECGNILLIDDLGQITMAVQCDKSAKCLRDKPAFERTAEVLLDALSDLPPVFSALPCTDDASLSKSREGGQLDNLDRVAHTLNSNACAYYYIVPLQSKGRKMGVMSLFGHNERSISQREANTLAIIGHQIGVAVENTQLYEAAERRAKKLQAAYEQLEKTQAELVKAERLAAMGQIAVTVSHEINNPLTVVLGNIERLLAAASALPIKSRERLRRIEAETIRIRDVVRKLGNNIEDRPAPYVGQTMMIDIHNGDDD
ncbi:MAG: response regulator [Chloroflexi bacterium]|nr:response regulator [Chloroflexota bacterium]